MSWRLICTEVDPAQVSLRDSHLGKVNPASRLADLVRRLGGYTGHIDNPIDGESYQLSLEQWRDRGPEATYVLVRFEEEPD